MRKASRSTNPHLKLVPKSARKTQTVPSKSQTFNHTPIKWYASGRAVTLLIGLGFLLTFGLIGYDFFKIATTGLKNDVDLREQAYQKVAVTTQIPARRGTIYERHDKILAEELTSYKLYANLNPKYGPSYVEDADFTATVLSQHIAMSKSDILALLSRPDASHIEFGSAGRALTYLEMQTIKGEELPGIGFETNSMRFYPNEIFASHTIGYAVYDTSVQRIVGHMGLELAFNDLLTGQDGQTQYLQDRKGYPLPHSDERDLIEPSDGHDVMTTLDFNIQHTIEQALTEIQTEFDPEKLIAIVADAKTGEILGMANRDTFDPNKRDVENYYNPMIQEPFEPGSTMKIYTYAAAIEAGTYNGNATYASGSIKEGGITIRDWKPQGWGTLSLDQGFYISSNVGIITLLTSRVTTRQMMDTFEAFGFGTPTHLGLPHEEGGTLPRETDYTNQLTAGFGQGFLTTPMQHIRALTAVVNEGLLIEPTLIQGIRPAGASDFEPVETLPTKQIVSAHTAQELKRIMYGVVNDELYGSAYLSYRVEGIEAGGKTGTAQIADEENGGYLRGANDYIYSYAGFVPFDEPEYLVYYAIQQPKSGRLSGHGILGELHRGLITKWLTPDE